MVGDHCQTPKEEWNSSVIHAVTFLAPGSRFSPSLHGIYCPLCGPRSVEDKNPTRSCVGRGVSRKQLVPGQCDTESVAFRGGVLGRGWMDQPGLEHMEEGWEESLRGGRVGHPSSRPCPCAWGVRWSSSGQWGDDLKKHPTVHPCWAGTPSHPMNQKTLISAPVLSTWGEANIPASGINPHMHDGLSSFSYMVSLNCLEPGPQGITVPTLQMRKLRPCR